MRLDSVYIGYWSLRDPLTQSQVLPVVKALAARGWRMALITFEQPPWALAGQEREQAAFHLREQGIRWIPCRYRRRPRVLATLFDILEGAIRARKTRARLFHGRGSVAASMALLASRFSKARLFDDADGPLSAEYVDAGLWSRTSLGYRMTAWAEQRCLDVADAIAVLSAPRAREVERTGRPLIVLPCAVDTAHFRPCADVGRRLRSTLGLAGVVFVYAGKMGGWYLVREMMDFVAGYRASRGEASLLVLTTTPPQPFRELASARGIPCVVRAGERAEMPELISAGHAGLSFVLPAPSKVACSPVKNGEYLACGLPVVTTAGIGDYSALIAGQGVGVVVPTLDEAGYHGAAKALQDKLREPDLAERCRRTACEHVGLEEVVLPRYFAIYERLLGPRIAPS